EPFLILIVFEDAVIQLARLRVGDPVEVNPVEVFEGRELIPIETRATRVLEILPGLHPPLVERSARLPGRDWIDPRVVTVAPEARQVHAMAAIGLDISGKGFEWPEMIVRVDGRHGVEVSLDAFVGWRLARGGKGLLGRVEYGQCETTNQAAL